ncbi:MAG: hypothetical protein V7L00_09920 [Nostoc sp.]|uniref:hypothetical protein n=1 Tax=unclassified Nostoc TaxID=2593658 RepID=UPI0025D7289E|nr:hypothetical protein [Nostoc sp. JL33]MBN3872232.1 hypothetical protein [Nostoc sp. JL33]
MLNSSFKNPNEIFELIIDFHHGIAKIIIGSAQFHLISLIPGIVGATGASIAIFMIIKVFGWRS